MSALAAAVDTVSCGSAFSANSQSPYSTYVLLDCAASYHLLSTFLLHCLVGCLRLRIICALVTKKILFMFLLQL